MITFANKRNQPVGRIHSGYEEFCRGILQRVILVAVEMNGVDVVGIGEGDIKTMGEGLTGVFFIAVQHVFKSMAIGLFVMVLERILMIPLFRIAMTITDETINLISQ